MAELEKIIIDTDIGDDIDDAFAITLAAKMNCFDILGITTVYRNSLQRAKIAAALADKLGLGVGVYAGRDFPLEGDINVEDFEEVLPDGRPVIPHYFEEFSGYGIGEKDAVDFIAETADKYPGEVTLVAIGPLTNVAEAATKHPQSFSKLKRIVLMGGKLEGQKAEWNVRMDPKAADITLKTGVPIKFVGLDVTAYTYLTDEDIAEICEGKGEEVPGLKKMLIKWMKTHPAQRPTMHDPLTVCEAVNSFCEYTKCRVTVSREGCMRGRIIKDPAGVEAEFAVKLDRDGFIKYFKNTIKKQK